MRTPERFWRWCRRKPIIAGLVAALLLSLLAGGGLATWFWQVAEANCRKSEMHAEIAEIHWQQAEKHLQDVETARRQEEKHRHLAEQHLQDAKRAAQQQAAISFKQAHQIVGELCIRVSEKTLRSVPGLHRCAANCWKTRYAITRNSSSSAATTPDCARSWPRRSSGSASLPISLVHASRAGCLPTGQELYLGLLPLRPGNAPLEAKLANAYINGGQVQQSLNQPRAALLTYDRAAKLLEPRCPHPPGAEKGSGSPGAGVHQQRRIVADAGPVGGSDRRL